MSNSFQFVPLSQLKEKFPEGSWWAQNYQDFTDDHIAAYYNGDLILPSLDLDWEQPFPQQQETILIFIDGNLTVDNLYNENTDGAIGLMVMGNLTAKNIAVGGQEIYIEGNLLVEEILCGSYNHGETIVKGNLNAAVLIEDDEYRFKTDGQQYVACTVNVWERDGVCQELPVDIGEVLVEDVLDIDDEEIDFLFGMLVSTLKKGHSALKDLSEALQRKRTVELYFTDSTLNEENIMKLTRCVLMPDDKHYFDFEEQGTYFKVNREYVDAEGDTLNPGIYMLDAHNHYFIYLEEEQTVSLQRKSMDEGAVWEDITDESQEQLSDISYYWTMLLTCINVTELYLPAIDRLSLKEVLQQPRIQALDPAGEENDGFWDGSKYYRFRQAHTDEDGDYLDARIEIQTSDGAFYFYTLDNEKYVSRHYQPPNEYGRKSISYLDSKRWEVSERYFTKFMKFISRELEEGASAEED
ncbi:hypothetical protein NQ117_12170 [Paenibacillus sp. SC116]|uniref:hypothetical protein n=1 Tax=Paenibacillus sp. SC116 TaxID=2968986 RepID=UPI00215A1B86|nr:hypothetical protein [Paenibacillus sp. SC116]MCR8844441.1 hypothetical protein [Paenibacillus sp. SC116]